MHLRRLLPADLPALRRLRLQALHEAPAAFSATPAGEAALSDAQWLARLDGPLGDAVWGLWDGQAQDTEQVLAGMAGLWCPASAKLAHKAEVYGVYVAPALRGRGGAHALLQALIAHARSNGLHALVLGVNAGHAAACAFYQRLGFVPYGREAQALRVDGEWHDELRMRLALQPPQSQS